MKRIFFLVLAVILWRPAQGQGLVPKPIPCYEPKIYTPGYAPGTNPKIDFAAYNCVDIFGPIAAGGPNLIEKGRTDVVAGKSVRIGPGTHIGPLPDSGFGPPHYFHAYIGENDFEVVWFEPNDTPGEVGQYEKLELGIKLPFPLDSMVYNYVHHNMTSTIEWLNPFDPAAINVEAEFSYNGETYNQYSPVFTKTRYGFYYEEYERVVNGNDTLTDDGWNQDTTSYNFRIRFSPNKIGQWAVKIKIETPIGNYECLPITFECVPSDNPGFVKVGPSNTFLSIGDNNEDFYPIGMNLEWPRCDELDEIYGPNYCPWIDDLTKYTPEAPAWNYKRYEELMTALADGGANYFRQLITPWTYDVEFEELGNYSNRMINAWELDRSIEKAEELNLKIQMCLTVHYNFENPSFYTMTNWDWEKNTMPVGDKAYGYSDDLGLSIEEFFSDPTARKHYKNRLRYILSRINYSSSVGVYEIASEMNNFGVITEYTAPNIDGYSQSTGKALYAPYHQDSSFATAGGEWLEYMADYIKNGLEMDEHPLASCYTGDPYNRPFDKINGVQGEAITVMGDKSIESPLFDIGAFNYYKTTLDKWKTTKTAVDNHVYGYGNPDVWLHKPLMHAETDMANVYDCATPIDWIREVYVSPFTGIAGAFHWHFSFRTDLWTHYGNVMDFMNMVLPYNHISTSTWKPFHNYIETTDEDEQPQVEVYSLVNDYTSNSDRTFGIVVNRTYNSLSVYTSESSLHNDICDSIFLKLVNDDDGPAAFPSELGTLTSIADVDGGHKLKIHNMETGDYNIKWYNPFDMSIVQVNYEPVSVVNHNLELDFPDLVVTESDPDYLPFVFFTAYKDEAKSLVIQPSDTATIPVSTASKPYTCTIYPNPQNSLSPVNINCGLKIKKVSLYTSAGKHIQTYDKVSGIINLPLLGRGIYQIKIVLEDETIQNHRLVVLD